MPNRQHLTAADATRIQHALNQGDVDEVFCTLAEILTENRMKLSDTTLRLYIESELFECFCGQSDLSLST